jgi:hypothetical protein
MVCRHVLLNILVYLLIMCCVSAQALAAQGPRLHALQVQCSSGLLDSMCEGDED